MPTVHLLIKGKVQGVFYRAGAKEMADALDVKGWVKNTAEGHVEATVSGSDASVQQFIAWCRKGPEKAIVTAVEARPVPEESFESFRIMRGF